MGIGLLLFGLVFATFGAGFAAVGLWHVWRGWQSNSWPSTRGKVTHSHVQRTISHGKHGTSTSESPVIEYVYKVDGERYEGNRYRFGGQSSAVGLFSMFGKSKARQIVEAHPKGKRVEVFYDPDKPQASTLVPGAAFGMLFFVIVGGLFALVGLGVAGFGVMSLVG